MTGAAATRRWTAAGLLLVVAGVAARLAGIDWGLPAIYDPDEPDFVNRAMVMLATGNLDPGWFGHPGSATMYSYLAAFAAYAATAGGGIAAAVAGFAEDPSRYFLLGRLVTAAFAGGTLVVAWRFAGRATAGSADDAGARFAGLVALALLALAPLHTQFSRIARPDIEMVFFVTLSAYFAIAVARRGAWRDYLAAGFFLGLGVATKYPAVLFAPLVALAHVLGNRDRGLAPAAGAGQLAGAAVAALGGLAVGAPFLLLSPGVALADIRFEARTYHLSGTSTGFASTLYWYVAGVLRNELGWTGLVLLVAGAWTAVREQARGAQLALAALVVYVPVMATLDLRWERWMLPAVPFACVLAGVGAATLWRTVAAARGALAGVVAAVALAGVTVFEVGMASVPWTVAGVRGDSRDEAAAWIGANVPPMSRVLLEAYTPQLPPDRYRLYHVNGRRIWPLDANGRRYAVPVGVIGTLADVDEIARYGMDYVVIANNYDRRLAEADRYAAEVATYQGLMARHELVFEVLPGPWRATGLPVRIYRVRR